jgi:ATP-dependent DNA ligase
MSDSAVQVLPMEARLVDVLPEGVAWQYEPKWDGFRAIAARSGDTVTILSRSGKPLGRYFPEIVAALLATAGRDFVLDGELILPVDKTLSFDALQARLHPAASRIRKLSRETPAQFMLFDCLQSSGETLLKEPLDARRTALERFHAAEGNGTLLLSPYSYDLATAHKWLAHTGGALDGVVAKNRNGPYVPGERAMLKVKQHRTADCVVGGFRRSKAKDGAIASLLLGLYDDRGLLNHVGFTASLGSQEASTLASRLDPLIEAPGFTGKTPGGPSRWSAGKESVWFPLKPELVVEVVYDQVTANRFRHGTRLLRWRPDKPASGCRMDQLQHELRPSELPDLAGS